MTDPTFDGLKVAAELDGDGDLRFMMVYTGDVTHVERANVARLRDHLTVLLGERAASDPMTVVEAPSSAMSRDEALKVAEETVNRLAPGVDSRGYATSNDLLRARVDSILRLADYLTGKGSA